MYIVIYTHKDTHQYLHTYVHMCVSKYTRSKVILIILIVVQMLCSRVAYKATESLNLSEEWWTM